MNNLVSETNSRIQEIIENLTTIKVEYENKFKKSAKEIHDELNRVKKYKEDFFIAKQKIEKMNSDIEGFEQDYQNLVDRFKDDELANILIAANKEISAKISERRRNIAKDKAAMNGLVEKAEQSKNKLVKLTAEKKALELCLAKIIDAYEFYSRALNQVIKYTEENTDNLSKCFFKDDDSEEISNIDTEYSDEKTEDDFHEEYIIDEEISSILNEEEIEGKDIFEEEIEEEPENDDDVINIDDIDEPISKVDEIDYSDLEGIEDTIEEDELSIEFEDEDSELSKDNETIENNEDGILDNSIDLNDILDFDDSIES